MSTQRLNQLCTMADRINQARRLGGENGERADVMLAGLVTSAAILLPPGKWMVLRERAGLTHEQLKTMAQNTNQWCPALPEESVSES